MWIELIILWKNCLKIAKIACLEQFSTILNKNTERKEQMKRASGVLMHISSLWGDYSCGSFGTEAKEFIDFLAGRGFSWWQVLPFCMVDECNSPYKSYSAFGGNPYFVDLPALAKKGYLTKDELLSARQHTPYSCEFERLICERFELLKHSSKRALGYGKEQEIKEFINKRPHIGKFCEFMALKEANSGKAWNEWTVSELNEESLFAWQFIQYEFFAQWAEIKDYANSKGIKILGDIPIYVSYDSADVWANKELFQLNDDGSMKKQAGVPPDYFSANGQLWGNPLYNWDKMKQSGYSWWQERMAAMLEMFDGVRIDHFRAIESYWSVDAKSQTAREGEWVKGPGMDFIEKLNVPPEKLIVAEDLGLITPQVARLVEESGFPGMRVMQFGFLDNSDSTHLPHNYINNCIAYTGTHDNNTLLGYVWEIGEENRKRLMEYCGYTSPDWDKGYDHIIRTLFASNAGIVIMPVQDILGYGSDTRLNTPGRADGNWMYRVTKEQLEGIDKEKYKRLNELYKRN